MPRTATAEWKTISIQPLSGGLDVRSRPADIPSGWMRWKTNLATTPLGKLCRRGGFQKAWADKLYDDNGVPLTDPNAGSGVHYHNHDLHHQGDTREPITFQYENTWANGLRTLFAGTQSRLYRLDESTGWWETLVSGKGAFPSVWRAATLNDAVFFTNGVDDLQMYPNGGPVSTVPQLLSLTVTAANVIIEYNGFIFIMNHVQGGIRYPTRVRWSDLNDGTVWFDSSDPSTPNSFAGFQDLPYGENIVGAGVLLGALYIFTTRSIWRCTVASAAPATFNFTRVYNEPKNQTGCLVYPYTLVSDGQHFWYMSRDAIYKYGPYMDAPDRKEADGNDWLYRAAGAIYTKIDTEMSGVLCNLPCAEFIPTTRELVFSWPSGSNAVNNWTIYAQIDWKTADIVDHGYTSMVNFRRVPTAPGLCNEQQSFLAASGTDWCIKDVGGVFYREIAAYNQSDPEEDLPTETLYVSFGYSSVLRGLIPTGLTDREKIIRRVLLDDDVSEEAVPGIYRFRLGNSYNIRDPNDMDDSCAVLWQSLGDIEVACIDGKKMSAMKAANQRPNIGKEWNCFYEGRFLFFELSILNKDGTPRIGSDTCLERIDFDLLVKQKP